ncbi:hypothetical protein C1752_01497 [Acaryochloris thomasi RCC1774]|uniref:Uncharacterized protein n=1 Tax=Acaryochloris thomasi RCC1774 TaxID=1764569 RepID=A0A2W1K028_9CYAN|nr:hypothetical protein [Acaryochloris thomasi]PZD74021.1 hypothetical protein C1752_01497 [Acaryochloris thomasi RCC1774]
MTKERYVPCHGERIEAGAGAGEYLLPVDVGYDAAANNIVASTALLGGELTQALRSIPSRRLVVVSDCCHAIAVSQLHDDASLKHLALLSIQLS